MALDAFLGRLTGELVIVMSDNATGVAYLRKQGATISKTTCDLAHETVLCGGVLSEFDGMVHPRKEHSSGPAESSQPGPSHRVVSSSPGLQYGV